MSKKASPTLVGSFVLGAVALLVAGVVVFGSGRLFKSTVPFVLSFNGSVNGLSVGAPVKFKGVEVGSVTDIRLSLNADENAEGPSTRVPVVIEIDEDRVLARGVRVDIADRATLERLVDAGLRGQLNAQSFVTGLLFVELDFHPDTAADFTLGPDSPYLEIPTIPNVFEQAQTALAEVISDIEKLNLQRLFDAIAETVEGIKRIVNADGVQKAAQNLDKTMANLDETLASVRRLSDELGAKAGTLGRSVEEIAAQTRVTLETMDTSLRTVRDLLDPSAPLAVQLQDALDEISGAARSVRLLAGELERNPSALIRGRKAD
ncbi:MAG: MCE family protein [bacterium]|nr:MCE family protein [bacterium]